MSNYVIDPPAVTAVPVAGGGSFPVRRIFCVGRNYAEHAREMGHDPDREDPFFFTKPADALLINGADMPYPSKTSDLHHEMELVVAIGSGGKDIPESEALAHVYGYAAGLDMTRRDLQAEAKRMGRPWEIGKAFDGAAPCSAIVPAARIGHPSSGAIWLEVNGELRQRGDIGDQIWRVPELVAHLSHYFVLEAGDVIFTGTPAGVGPVQVGDRLLGGVDGIGTITIEVGAAR